MEAKQAENEQLRREKQNQGSDEARMRELNEEQTTLKLENASIKKDMKELLAARENESKAHESRVKVRNNEI